MKKTISILLLAGLSLNSYANSLISPINARDIKLYKKLIRLCQKKSPDLTIGKSTIAMLSTTKEDRQKQMQKLVYPSYSSRFNTEENCQTKSSAISKLEAEIVRSQNTESSFPELKDTMLIARKNLKVIKNLVKKY